MCNACPIGYVSTDIQGDNVLQEGTSCILSFKEQFETFINSTSHNLTNTVDDKSFTFLIKDERVSSLNLADTSQFIETSHTASKVYCVHVSKTPFIFIHSTYKGLAATEYGDLFTDILIPYNSLETYSTQTSVINHIDEELMIHSIFHNIPTQNYTAIVFCDTEKNKIVNKQGDEITNLGVNSTIICAYKSTHSFSSTDHVLYEVIQS
tara:strand:- start:5890 stop:6513 length:624 start_codon:yes stop_codon:yes gene_type:complete